MQRVAFSEAWPVSWKESYDYDLLEIYGESHPRGYAYAYAERRRHALELIRRAAAPPATVLDVAAAQGNFTLALAELGYEVTWNDLRAELAGYVALKHERGMVHYAPGNALGLRFGQCFDIVLIAEVIEHTAHPDAFLAGVARMVKPGGHVVMTTPNGSYFRNALPRFSEHPDPSTFETQQFGPNARSHIFLLHGDEIAPLAAGAGLEVVEHRVFNNFLTNGHLKTDLLLRVLPRGLVAALERLTRRAPFRLTLHTSMATLFRKPL
jgi:2-polyprenyl-6-hydroxyphenyl methylase/3-demethylubiquinone-9 3-methyltransferase